MFQDVDFFPQSESGEKMPKTAVRSDSMPTRWNGTNEPMSGSFEPLRLFNRVYFRVVTIFAAHFDNFAKFSAANFIDFYKVAFEPARMFFGERLG